MCNGGWRGGRRQGEEKGEREEEEKRKKDGSEREKEKEEKLAGCSESWALALPSASPSLYQFSKGRG